MSPAPLAPATSALRLSPTCLEGLAGVGGARGQAGRAARLYGAAAALREAIGVPLPPSDRAVRDQDLAAARAALGESAFDAAWAAGQAMPLEQAVADAFEDMPDSA